MHKKSTIKPAQSLSSAMKNIYLLPGLGADERLFQNWDIPNASLYPIRYTIHESKDSLKTYAQKLLPQIKHERPILIGHSLGGILAQEIAALISVEKTIVFCSIKTVRELPPHLLRYKRFPYYKLLPAKWLNQVIPIAEQRWGGTSKGSLLYWQMLKANKPEFLKWAFDKVIHWKRQEVVNNLIHIQGTREDIFPIQYLENPFIEVDYLGHFPYACAGQLCELMEKLIKLNETKT